MATPRRSASCCTACGMSWTFKLPFASEFKIYPPVLSVHPENPRLSVLSLTVPLAQTSTPISAFPAYPVHNHPTVTSVHPNATPQSQRCNTHRKPSSTKPLPFPPLPHNPNYETLLVSRPRQPPLLPNYVLESCPRLLLSPKPRDACTQRHHRRHTSRGSLAAVTTRIAGKTCTASIPVFPSPSLPPRPF